MTKGEFIDKVAKRTGLSKKDAGAAVDAVLGTISDTLKGGGDVAFTGFGKFHVTKRSARTGVNPRNPGQKVQIPAATRAEVLRRLDAQGRRPGLGVTGLPGVAPSRCANIRRMAGRTPPTRASVRSAPARAGRGRPARSADRGERRAAGARRAAGVLAGSSARAGRAGAPGRSRRSCRTTRASLRCPDGRVGLVGLASPARTPLTDAAWTVVDLETTGVGASARIVEIGAVRLEGDEQVARLSRLVDPGIPMPSRITQITGIRDRDLAGAGPLRPAVAEFLALARGSIFVAHNASFDVGMLDRALMRLDGTRIGMRVLDTRRLARRLLAGRVARFDLASLSERFDVTRPAVPPGAARRPRDGRGAGRR